MLVCLISLIFLFSVHKYLNSTNKNNYLNLFASCPEDPAEYDRFESYLISDPSSIKMNIHRYHRWANSKDNNRWDEDTKKNSEILCCISRIKNILFNDFDNTKDSSQKNVCRKH